MYYEFDFFVNSVPIELAVRRRIRTKQALKFETWIWKYILSEQGRVALSVYTVLISHVYKDKPWIKKSVYLETHPHSETKDKRKIANITL